MPVDARIEAEKLRKMYEEDPRQKYANILLTGETGTGKTYSLLTAPRPVHIDSFDPGGTKGLKKAIQEGYIIPDVRFEDEDPMNPSVFKEWKNIFTQRAEGHYFDSIGTYCLDSSTTWTDAILNYHQGKRSGAGTVPEWNKDYHPQKVDIRNYLRVAMKQKCHFILTGHLEVQKDKEGNVVARRFMMTGKGAVVIPLLFDEIWVAETKETPKGLEYQVLLQKKGLLLGRSRLAADGVLGQTEPLNLREIFKKAGMSYEDKPALEKEVKK